MYESFVKSMFSLVIKETLFVVEAILCISILQTSMNARMVTMEDALTSVPILVEVTSVYADVAMNSRGKVEPLEVVVWT